MTTACPCCGQPVDTGGLLVSLDANAASRWGKTTRLYPMEAEMAYALLQAYPACLTRGQIIRAAYGYSEPDNAEERILSHIGRIRSRLRPLGVDVVATRFHGVRMQIRGDTP